MFHLTVLLERTKKLLLVRRSVCKEKGGRLKIFLVRKMVDLGPLFQFPHVMRNWMVSRDPSKMGTLPETNSSQLKMDGWNSTVYSFLLGPGLFSVASC